MKAHKIIKNTALLSSLLFVTLQSFANSHNGQEVAANAALVPAKEIWVPVGSAFSDWMPYGDSTVESDWSPAIKAQTKDFTQAITKKQVMRRLEQKRERNSVTGKVRYSGKPIYIVENRISKTTRKISVYPGTKTNTVKKPTSDWFPASEKQTKEYLQGRTYSQMQEQVIEYYNGKKLIDTVFATPSIDNLDEMRTVSVVEGNWVPKADAENCSSWNPKPAHPDDNREILQSRICTQQEERVTTHHSGDEVVHSFTESRINKKVKQERYVRAEEAYFD